MCARFNNLKELLVTPALKMEQQKVGTLSYSYVNEGRGQVRTTSENLHFLSAEILKDECNISSCPSSGSRCCRSSPPGYMILARK